MQEEFNQTLGTPLHESLSDQSPTIGGKKRLKIGLNKLGHWANELVHLLIVRPLAWIDGGGLIRTGRKIGAHVTGLRLALSKAYALGLLGTTLLLADFMLKEGRI